MAEEKKEGQEVVVEGEEVVVQEHVQEHQQHQGKEAGRLDLHAAPPPPPLPPLPPAPPLAPPPDDSPAAEALVTGRGGTWRDADDEL